MPAPNLKIKIDQTNLKRTLRAMKSLPKAAASRVSRKAVRKASSPVVKALRKAQKKRSGLLKKAISRKFQTYRKSGVAIAIIGVNKDIVGSFEGRKAWPAKYWHLVEKGTKRSRANDSRNRVMAEKKGEVARIMEATLAVETANELRKIST